MNHEQQLAEIEAKLSRLTDEYDSATLVLCQVAALIDLLWRSDDVPDQVSDVLGIMRQLIRNTDVPTALGNEDEQS